MKKSIIIFSLAFLFFTNKAIASLQAKLQINTNDSNLLAYVYAPDNLEFAGNNLISMVQGMCSSVNFLDPQTFFKELNDILTGKLQYPEIYGALITSPCSAKLYKLGFFENGQFIPYAEIQQFYFCQNNEISSITSEVQELLEKYINTNLFSSSFDIPIIDSLEASLTDFRYLNYSFQEDKIIFDMYSAGLLRGSFSIYGVNCQVLSGNFNCYSNNLTYFINDNRFDGTFLCKGTVNLNCEGWTFSEEEEATCSVRVESPQININDKTVTGTAETSCNFDWYNNLNFSRSIPFQVQSP